MGFLGKKRRPRSRKLKGLIEIKAQEGETPKKKEPDKPISFYLWNSLTLGEKFYVKFWNEQKLTGTQHVSTQMNFSRRSKKR